MGAASTDRLIQRRAARQRAYRENRNRENRELRAQLMEDRRLVWKQAHDKIAEAREAEAEANDRALDLQAKLDVIHTNGPAVIEIVQVKQMGLLGRLRWALGVAFTGKLRWERSVRA